ncbi:MAG: NYN domain-containing protein [Actinobacteria bacterium]|nr:NYN domain-containing protein [Actinomycetota bacterium]
MFIDYQNCYKGARWAFFEHSLRHMDGQVYPRRLAIRLKDAAAGDRELVGIRVYRGLPSSLRDPKGYGAADRQMALWKQQALVEPISRPLNYRDPAVPKEKGIDVRLAIDMVMMAIHGDFDVAVLFSDDTDLVPAIEAVLAIRGSGSCEVATWVPSDGRSATPLRVSGCLVHRLKRADYDLVEDATDYTVRRRRR